MALLSRWLRLPRLKKFLHFMSLRTGVEMISLSMLFNRVAGFYGLMAILTGYRLDAAQLSFYIYSMAALILLAFLMPHIRKQSPLECIVLAWFYAADTLLSCAYTTAFSVSWFVTLGASMGKTPGITIMNDTAGLTSPVFNVSAVNVMASSSVDLVGGQDAVAIREAASVVDTTHSTVLQHVPALVIIILLTLARFYFVLVVMAYARQALHQCLHNTSSARNHIVDDGSSDEEDVNPFTLTMPLGQGWRGKLGRALVFLGRGYFLDGPVDDGWERGVNSRFKPATVAAPSERRGTFERERRARSGTGPPLPLPDLSKAEI